MKHSLVFEFGFPSEVVVRFLNFYGFENLFLCIFNSNTCFAVFLFL